MHGPTVPVGLAGKRELPRCFGAERGREDGGGILPVAVRPGSIYWGAMQITPLRLVLAIAAETALVAYLL
ncbi:MAG: hypothetical protein M3312_00300 [Actinomycetota bacterium]|nr:hypothetical protein [Actinomycetota bacterium]